MHMRGFLGPIAIMIEPTGTSADAPQAVAGIRWSLSFTHTAAVHIKR